MNFCTKCRSTYEKPGTCNCFAPSPVPGITQPIWIRPTYPDYPAYPIGTTITYNDEGGSVREWSVLTPFQPRV